MIKVDKIIKSGKSSKSRIKKIAKRIKKIQALNKSHITVRTYKKHLQHYHTSKKIPHKPTTIHKSHISSLGLDTVSPIPIIRDVNIPDMELIEKTPDTIQIKINTKSDLDTSYIIVIPSFNRPELIQSKTLALLYRHNIPHHKITIFVANKEQYDLYKSTVPQTLYGSLVIGVLGLKNQRNFIMDYYPEGTNIVQMDDDLDKIVELIISGNQKTIKPIENLHEFIQHAFQICREKNIFLWGVYPLANSRFMTPTITTNLRFIVGPFWGVINRHRNDLKLTIDEKENTERTLQHYVIDHAVLRFNNVGIETRYYKNKGGMQNEGKNRKDEALKSVYYLHKKYPKLTKIYLGKKSGIPEIKLLV